MVCHKDCVVGGSDSLKHTKLAVAAAASEPSSFSSMIYKCRQQHIEACPEHVTFISKSYNLNIYAWCYMTSTIGDCALPKIVQSVTDYPQLLRMKQYDQNDDRKDTSGA